MRSIIRIAYIIMSLISLQLQTNAQNLPLVCGGSRARYGVTGEAGSTYEWQIVGGMILQNYNDSVDVQWYNDKSDKSLSVSEHTNEKCNGLPASAIIPASAPTLVLGPSTQTCANIPLVLDPVLGYQNFKFLWSTGDTTHQISLNKEGWYKLKITDIYGCVASDSLHLNILKVPNLDTLKNEVQLCEGNLILDAGPDGIIYNWSNGGMQQTNMINFEENIRLVSVSVENADGCISKDTVKIACTSNFKIPNAFTPNNDGDNDTWKLRFLENFPKASVDIFDRWGRRIFECKGGFPSEGWDGNHNGRKLPMDTYFYVIKLNDGSSASPQSGAVDIIR